MLRLKRASAGSGKTYELAKTYIKLLLTSKFGTNPRQLRNANTLQESLGSIMAVTFTVKATAEMKQRIVEKLAELARADMMTPEEREKVDYLEEFEKDLHIKYTEIAPLARRALQTLLLHYSDFKVSTIDSFFQSILHTFAYEASLDDNFNMEIDTDYVATKGLDTALDDLTESGSGSEDGENILYWLREMMESRVDKRNWNVFMRNEGKSLYSELIQESQNLDKENFQKIRAELTEYFENLEEDFSEIVKTVDAANEARWRDLHDKRLETARELKKVLDKAGLTPKELYNKQGSKLKDILTREFDLKSLFLTTQVGRGAKDDTLSLSADGLKILKENIRKNPELNSTIINELNGAYLEWREAANKMLEEYEQHKEELNTWIEYRKMFPMLMLMLEIAKRKDSYLKNTNSLQISDTNHILSQIIDGEDTPFVYERMGTRLNHYLIDEFQDTSRMQWDNLYPLLAESDAAENDNLIIGDAKQSIYRFRNADYRLINEVAGKFSDVRTYTTESKPEDESKENTNYRSKPVVVNFNNYVFSNIVNLEQSKKPEDHLPIFSQEIKTIYADCIQALPRKKNGNIKNERKGYVEVIFAPKLTEEEQEDYDTEGDINLGEAGFRELPGRILELVSRGYKFRDIGILVKSHKQGSAAVAVINLHNEENPDNRIPVISEENMLVSTSLSVKMIIYALQLMVNGETMAKTGVAGLDEPIDRNTLLSMLRKLHTLSLPSIVEAIISRFIPEERRNEEAPFIAAFQDAVLDYSISRSNDIGTFLKWWKQKSKVLTIISPEDSDGVIIQTIHKAKGLEYKCVIVPYANFSFEPRYNNTEWRWLRPSPAVQKSELLPPYVPVSTGTALANTVHRQEREKFVEEYGLDELNKMYVAFTRAVDELIVYVPLRKKPANTASDALKRLLISSVATNADDFIPDIKVSEDETDGRIEVKIGTPATEKEVLAERQEEENKRNHEKTVEKIYSYESNSENGSVVYNDGNRLLRKPVHTGGEDEELDPRAEGELKHRIMQMVEIPEDLDKALLEMKVNGLISAQQIDEWGSQLRAAIESVADLGWFAPGVRVINERPLLNPNKTERPDRVIVLPDGEAVVIDYKFGEEEKKYVKKVGGYANLLRQTGLFNRVSAYIWYVPTGKIIKV